MGTDKPFKIYGPDKTFASSSGCGYYYSGYLGFLMYCVKRFGPNDPGILLVDTIVHSKLRILRIASSKFSINDAYFKQKKMKICEVDGSRI